MSSLMVDTWMHSTVLIENVGERGTGFLISRGVDEHHSKVFLITNKHILGRDREQRLAVERLKIYMNMKLGNGKVAGVPDEYPMYAYGERLWRGHPEEDVDVLAIDLTYLFELRPKVSYKTGTYDWIADKPLLEENQISAGDEVIVLGYPNGVQQGITVYPLVRQGIIASQIGDYLREDYGDAGDASQEALERRGFLIDGAIIPGSSGSPVILKPGPNRYLDGQYRIGEPTMPYLLGIVSETRYVPRDDKGNYWEEYTGLGFVEDGETISEAIECFFN